MTYAETAVDQTIGRRTGTRVTGIDITPAYVDAARDLANFQVGRYRHVRARPALPGRDHDARPDERRGQGRRWHATLSQTNALSAGSTRFPRHTGLHLGQGRMADDLRSLKPGRTIRLDVISEGQLALHLPVTYSVPGPN